MAIESIGQAASAAPAQTAISQDDFLKILSTQLSFQDPLKPMDNQQFMAQLAQFSSLEQTRQLNDGLQSLLQVQAASQSVGLIGRTVEVATPGGSVVGVVTTMRFVNGTPLLSLRGADGQALADIGLGNVVVVR